MSISQNYPIINPSLSLDFANTKVLDPRITYARASTATYYDGVTNSKAEENLVLRSQEFNVGWVNLSTTVTANTATAPDGTTTADLLYPTTTGNSRITYQILTLASATYTQSIFAKASGLNHLCIYQGGGTFGAAWFNLSTGAVGTVAGGFSATITSVGDSWYRCTVTFTGGANFSLTVGGVDADNSITATTSGLNGVLLWGAQTEQRSAVSSYTPTTTQAITRYQPTLLTAPSGVARFDHNPITTESLGLLIEEQRTNLLLRSEEFDNAAWSKSAVTITSNTLVAPDNTLTADKLNATTANTFHFVQSSNVTTTAVVTTVSMYVKSGGYDYVYIDFITGAFSPAVYFNLNTGAVVSTVGSPISPEIKSVGNGWYRCSFSFLAVAGASYIRAFISDTGSRVSFLGDGYSGIFIWGAQLEAGAFPTSYIPTVASQVTRSADSASMTGANFSSWYNVSQGSFYVNETIQWNATDAIPRAIMLTTSIGNGSILYKNANDTNIRSFDGTNILATPLVFGNNKFISAYGSGTKSLCVNAGTVVSGAYNNSWSTATAFSFGADNSGHIKKLSYFPARLSNEELQEMTS